MAITAEQIIDTAESLVARGQAPTLAAVRNVLGSGSFTTIGETLRNWREQYKVRQREAAQMPMRVQEAVAQAGAIIWTESMRQHSAQLNAERELFNNERERSAIERNEAIELADQLARELDQLRDEYAQIQQAAALAHDQQLIAEERSQRTTALESALREAEAELAVTRSQVETLRTECAEMRQEAHHALRETEAHRLHSLAHESALDALRTELSDARDEVEVMTQRAVTAEAKVQTLQNALYASRTR